MLGHRVISLPSSSLWPQMEPCQSLTSKNWSVWLINSMLHSTSWAKATFAWTVQHNWGISPTMSPLVIKSPTSHLQHRKSPITWPLWITIPRLAFSLSVNRGVNIGCGAENWQGKLGFLSQVTAPTGVFVLIYTAVMKQGGHQTVVKLQMHHTRAFCVRWATGWHTRHDILLSLVKCYVHQEGNNSVQTAGAFPAM